MGLTKGYTLEQVILMCTKPNSTSYEGILEGLSSVLKKKRALLSLQHVISLLGLVLTGSANIAHAGLKCLVERELPWIFGCGIWLIA